MASPTRAEFVELLAGSDWVIPSDMKFARIGAQRERGEYRINCGDAPMNCHTCPIQTTGRAVLRDGTPVVRCPYCFQRYGYRRA